MLGIRRLPKVLNIPFLRMTSTTTTRIATINSVEEQSEENSEKKFINKKNLIATAFENLKVDEANNAAMNQIKKTSDSSTPLDEKISNAKTVNGLLSIPELSGQISRKHALKIVSILADWSSLNRVKLNDFESDTRFIKICRVLGRNGTKSSDLANSNNANQNKKVSGFRTDDLNTVLGVAGDDEAAKLISSISLPQMVKVMTTLAQKKRRSTPLLRSLAYNISSSIDTLDLKQTADILYAMATLNFPDSVLTAKVSSDIKTTLSKNTEKSAVVGSILTSVGLLKYRDIDLLESLTQWIIANNEICRPQDLSALFLTLATLNYNPSSIEEIKKKLVVLLVKEDFNKKVDWLNHVWALTMLGLSDVKQIESVLSESFINKLESGKQGLSPNAKMKLLNINSYANLITANYKGPQLPADSTVFTVPLAHSKSKNVLLIGLLDALKSLLPPNNHVQTAIDTRMGFLLDALCIFDAKRNPLPLNTDSKEAIKVAIMVLDFHDFCHGPKSSHTGLTNMNLKLLQNSGYRVLTVPFNEFSTSDKLLKRVQYLEGKFKHIVSSQ